MEQDSELNIFLEMIKKVNGTVGSIKHQNTNRVKLNPVTELEFDGEGNFRGVINNHVPDVEIERLSFLIERVGKYFSNIFPSLSEEQFDSHERLVEEALVLAKHSKSNFQDEELWERIKNHFVDRYPHLDPDIMPLFSLITHGLVLSEDERLKKKTAPKRSPPKPKPQAGVD